MLTPDQLEFLTKDGQSWLTENEKYRHLGPQFTPEGLGQFADKLESNIRVLAGKEKSPKTKPLSGKEWETLETVEHCRPLVYSRENITIPDLPTFLKGSLQNMGANECTLGFLSVDELSFAKGEIEQRTTIRPKADNPFIVDVKVAVNRPEDPTTQEEFLHAAQELLAKHSQKEGQENPISNATTAQLVHSSYLVDLVLSAAALEQGEEEFLYWHEKAAQQTEKDQELASKNPRTVSNTLLGKEVNRRFNYPQTNAIAIGTRVNNLGTYLDKLVFDRREVLSDPAALSFELGSLAYGEHHRDLAYSLVDIAADPRKPEEVGRAVIDWGKKVLQHYKGTPMEPELVTHHTLCSKAIERTTLNYELPQRTLEYLNIFRQTPVGPTSFSSETTQNRVLRDIWDEKIEAVMTAYLEGGQNLGYTHFRDALKENGLSLAEFKEALKKAQINREDAFVAQESNRRSHLLSHGFQTISSI